MKSVPLGDLLVKGSGERLGTGRELPLLSMTMRDGLVDQSSKFKKVVASRDLTSYKVVRQGQLVVGFPIDEAVLAIQRIYPAGIVSPAYAVWDVRTDLVDPSYLERYLKSPRAISYYVAKLRGSTARRRSLPKTDFEGMPIPLPPLPAQRRIASILDEAQSVRRLAESRVVLLEEMVRSAFRATEASASLARVRLSDIAEVVGGSTPKSGVAELWDGDIPWITPADLSKNADLIISKTARTISDQGLRSIGNRLLPTGAVLLSSRAPIGLVGIVGVPMATNQGFKSLIPDAEIVDSTYLYWWLRANRATLERRGVGATFKELSKTVVESIEVALPSVEEQQEFGRLAREAEEARVRAVTSLRQVQLLTDSLQNRAFRGEL